jgi:hypothetical protein
MSPCSTASPRYITSTPCATKRTTVRDEEISKAELLLQVEHQVQDLRLDDTSSAETGSSAAGAGRRR